MRELKRRGDPNVVIALAGNKSDIVAKRKVDAEVADEYAKEHSLIYMDTSAKTAHNVKELFDAIGAWQAVGGWLAWRGSRRPVPPPQLHGCRRRNPRQPTTPSQSWPSPRTRRRGAHARRPTALRLCVWR